MPTHLQPFLSILRSYVPWHRHILNIPIHSIHRSHKPIVYIVFISIFVLLITYGSMYSLLNLGSTCKRKRVIGRDGFCPVSTILRNRSHVATLERLQHCPLVLYNRVPKCASRTVLGIFKQLACQNGFHYVSEPKDKHEYFSRTDDMMDFAKGITVDKTEFQLYSRHVYFVNFSRLKLPEPMYINVIRDPLERAISHYYYNRHGSRSAPLVTPKANFIKTLDECMEVGRGACFSMAKILPFFCGHHSVCRKNNSIALKRAMRNVREYYVVVGITEDLSSFMKTVSILMPQFFKNATQVYESKSDELWAKYKTVKKVQIEESTKQRLKDLLQYEYEFYQFVKQRFYNIYTKVKRYKHQMFLNTIWNSELKMNI